MAFVFTSILGLVLPIFIIGAIVYLIVRKRNGDNGITAYHALISYIYFVIGASVITAVTGFSVLIYAILKDAYDGEKIVDDISLGLTLLGTGFIICILHFYGKQAIASKSKEIVTTLRRVYLFIMLSIFSLAGLISLPLAINSLVNYEIEESSHRDDPAAQLATAIVVVPLWIYYLLRILHEIRKNSEIKSLEK